MGDIVLIKMSDGKTMTSSRYDGFGDAAAQQIIVDELMAKHHPNKTAISFAIADAEEVSDLMDAGASLDDDFAIVTKSNIPNGSTGIAKTGQAMSDLTNTDECVCYTPAI